jgi:hypothetical protein
MLLEKLYANSLTANVEGLLAGLEFICLSGREPLLIKDIKVQVNKQTPNGVCDPAPP